MRQVRQIHRPPEKHWVGDGFAVHSLFSYHDHGRQLSPFLLLDYAVPTRFEPAQKPRGVGEHPHRGFETVTIVYQGEVAHRDSAGGGGRIGPGDVQWMTAGSGVVHEEFHSTEFTRRGGMLEMVQLWVNLPARDKMTRPRYQALRSEDIPRVPIGRGHGSLRVIAGRFGEFAGLAKTFTPVNVWDIELPAGEDVSLPIPDEHNLAAVVLRGSVTINGAEKARSQELVLFDRAGNEILLHGETDASVLVLSGAPIDEPVVGYGPFVMNTQQQISDAVKDYNNGRFDQLPSST